MEDNCILGHDIANTLLHSLGLTHLLVREMRLTMAYDDIMRMSLDCLMTEKQAAAFFAAWEGQKGRVHVEVCPLLPSAPDDEIG